MRPVPRPRRGTRFVFVGFWAILVHAAMGSPGSQAAAKTRSTFRRSASTRAGEAASSRTFDLGVTVITSFERPSEEPVGTPAGTSEAGTRAAALRVHSLYRQDHSEQPRLRHADRGSQLRRSSTSLIDATTEPDGSPKPVRSGMIALADVHPDLATGLTAAAL